MICNVCNKEVENGIAVCPYCGADLTKKEEKVIAISFKKPNPPPVIEVTFIEPEIVEEPVIEVEPIYYEEPIEEEPVVEEPALAPAKKVKKKKSKKKEEKPKVKSKDKINPLFLILSLLWAPYPGILLWVLTSKKTPKASQAYGSCGIIMFTLRCVTRYITSIITRVVTTVAVIVFIVGITAVLVITQYGITFA